VKAVGTKNTAGNSDSRFTLNSAHTTATASFTISGDNCNEAVTIASWQAPNGEKGRPYSEQKLFSHTTGTFNSGTHSLTVTLPDCYYQVDLVRGSSATDANGGPEYNTSTILGSLHGGTQTCTPTTPPTTPPTTSQPLPDTGAGTNIFVLSAIAAIAGYVFSYVRKMRGAKSDV